MKIRIGDREYDPGNFTISVTFDDRDIKIVADLEPGDVYTQVPTFNALDTTFMDELKKSSAAVRVEDFDEEVEGIIQDEEIQYAEMTPVMAVKRFWNEFPYRKTLIVVGGLVTAFTGLGGAFLAKLIMG